MKATFRRYLPYLLAVVLFFVLSALYFEPQYEGKTLNMHDDIQYKGMSQDIRLHNQLYGEDPQWTGNAFGGMPSYLNSIKYPSMIIRSAANGIMKAVGNPTWMIFLAMTSFWIMLLLWGLDPRIAVPPAIAYGFSTYSILIIGAGHLSKMMAFAYAPMLVGAVVYTFRSRHRWLGAMLAALFASLELAANHPQITYYFALAIIAFWINELVKATKENALSKFGKSTLALVAAAVLAIGSNFAPLYYTMQHSPDTTRGGSELAAAESGNSSKGLALDYATAWSYGKGESLNMFIPDFKGGASASFPSGGAVSDALRPYQIRAVDGAAYGITSYWGDQPGTAGPTYIGAVMFFLAVFGMFVLHGRSKWWILIVSLLALFLSWGNNMMWFTELMFKLLPGYNKFRAVATTLVIVQWSIPLLAALTLSKIYRRSLSREETMHGLKWSLAITGSVALFFWLFGKALFSFHGIYDPQLPDDILQAMYEQRGAMLTADSFRSLVFVVLSAIAVWLFAKSKIGNRAFVALLAVLVCADMIPVDLRFLPHSKFVEKRATEILPTAVDNEIMKDSELGFRVANLSVSTFNDATTSYFHRSVGGYHGAKLQRYQDIIDRYLSKMDMPAYNMLNTKYFIIPDQNTGALTYEVNPDANGAAWFVDNIVWVDGAAQEIETLGEIDNKHTAVADNRYKGRVQQTSALDSKTAGMTSESDTLASHTVGTIALTDYRPNRLIYEYASPAGGTAVFSEIYYDKGWSAYIDGQEAPYFRADYILRAMELPAGTHTVEFRFRAPHFKAVSTATLLFSLLILAGLALNICLTVRDERKNGNAGEQAA